MQIIRPKHTGFCFGVRRAIERVMEEVAKGQGKIYTLGPIIHNPQTVSMLREQGVIPVEDLSQVEDDGTVVFRTHGIMKEEEAYIRERGLKSIDATCPFVKRVRNHAVYLWKHGYKVVIAGDKNHPEVKSVLSYLDNDGIVLRESCSIEGKKVGVVSQTTLDWETFRDVVAGLLDGAEEVRVYDTICRSTRERQKEIVETAGLVDLMLIAGGRNSSNTTRLYELAKKVQPRTYHIETESDLHREWFSGVCKVGLTGGASTPDFIIDSLDRRLKNL